MNTKGGHVKVSKRVKLLARYERMWWQAHHRKDKEMFVTAMVALYVLQFGIPEARAKDAVKFRLKAADLHDIAERYEDKGQQRIADTYWERVEKALVKHFRFLEAEV